MCSPPKSGLLPSPCSPPVPASTSSTLLSLLWSPYCCVYEFFLFFLIPSPFSPSLLFFTVSYLPLNLFLFCLFPSFDFLPKCIPQNIIIGQICRSNTGLQKADHVSLLLDSALNYSRISDTRVPKAYLGILSRRHLSVFCSTHFGHQ